MATSVGGPASSIAKSHVTGTMNPLHARAVAAPALAPVVVVPVAPTGGVLGEWEQVSDETDTWFVSRLTGEAVWTLPE